MQKYSDIYQNVKNLAPVLNCLKGQAARSEQSTLQWQFGLRSNTVTSGDLLMNSASNSHLSDSRMIPVKASLSGAMTTAEPKNASQKWQKSKVPEQLRFQQTSFATRPEPDELNELNGEEICSEQADPMEGMVELPGGGYDLALFKGKSHAQLRQFDKV